MCINDIDFSTNLNTIGLIIDMIGVATLFFLSPKPYKKISGKHYNEQGKQILSPIHIINANLEITNSVNRKKKFKSYWSLGIIVFGFCLQIVSNYL